MSSTTQLPSAQGTVLVSPEDALVLLEAVRLGLIPRTTRRLTRNERDQLVTNGTVFIWEEEETGMQRWTDGRKWSCSRVVGEFLGYDQVEGAGPGRTRGNEGVPARRMPGGLVKQTFQTTMQVPNQTPKKFHVISYHTNATAHLLRRPSLDPVYSKLSLSLWASSPSDTSSSPKLLREGKLAELETRLSREKQERLQMYEDLLQGSPSVGGGDSSSRGGSSQGRPSVERSGVPGIHRSRSGGEEEYRYRGRRRPSGSRREEGWEEEKRLVEESRPRRVSGHPRHSHLLNSPTPSLASNTSSSSSSRSASPKYHHHPVSTYPYPARSVSSPSSLGLPHPPSFGPSSTQSWPATRPHSSSSRLSQSMHSHYVPSALPSPKWTHNGVQPLPSLADLSSSLPPLSSLLPSTTTPISSPPSRYYIGQSATPIASEDGNMLNRFVVRI